MKSFHQTSKVLLLPTFFFLLSVNYPYRILVLQAENEYDMNEWVQSLRTASQQALNSDSAPRYTQQSPTIKKVTRLDFID